MAGIKGTNVNAPVVPFDTNDQHPSHEARYGKGGYRTVATTVERDAIPVSRREAGMLVFVTGDGKVYKLLSDLTSWEEFKSGASTWEELAGKPSTFPPSSHAASHGQGGSDEITVAASQISGGSLPQNAVLDFNDGTSDSEIGGWGFGVETGGGSEYATVTATGIVIHGQTSSTTINPAGITFADGSQQTIAWTGSYSHTHDDRYYTESEVDTLLAGKATPGDVTAAVAAVVGAAPASLDTLQELAAALSNDGSFATTVTNSLAAKAPLASPTFTGTVSGITATMVGLGNVPNVDATARANHTGTQTASTISDFTTAAAAAAPVQSVNGQTGAVTIATYTLPVATASVLGGVKQGSNVTIGVDGTISVAAPVTSLPYSSITGTPTLSAVATSGSAADLTGTLSASRLPNTTVTAGTYGSATQVAQFTVDAAGRLTSAGSTAISIPSTSVTGLGTLATQNGTFSGTSSGTNTGDQTITLTGDVTGSGTGSFAATLANSGVSAGTYTSVTVDAKGRVTAGSSPAVAYSSLTGIPSTFAPSAHTHGNITNAGAIGSTSGQIVVTTASGVLTTAATISAATQVSGLAASATTDTTSASNITSGTLAAARIGTHASSHNPGGSDAVSLVEVYEFTRSSKPADATGSNGSYTWTPPAGCKAVQFLLVAPGGGGGSGRRGAAGSARYGGGGGAGGNVIDTLIRRSTITTALTITIPAGGAGGAAVAADDTNGNNGTAGGQTSVLFNGMLYMLTAAGGGGGGGGTTSAGSNGNAQAAYSYTSQGSVGGPSSVTGNATSGAGNQSAGPGMRPTGGSGGGGISTGNVAYNGGSYTIAGNASIAGLYDFSSNTGAGGNASTTTVGGTGSDGITYGFGGSGGGASANGNNSGKGGNGGDGYVRITCWY